LELGEDGSERARGVGSRGVHASHSASLSLESSRERERQRGSGTIYSSSRGRVLSLWNST